MNDVELLSELISDTHKIRSTTIERLILEYDRERKKKKISKERTYTRCYPIKTAAKNTWLVFLGKSPSIEFYRDTSSLTIHPIVYYYNQIGLRAFQLGTDGFFHVYNGHLFNRYNERMELGLNTPVEIMKRFFTHNRHHTQATIEKKGRQFSLSVCKEGMLLGEFQNDGFFLVHKTFISRDIFYADQDEVEKELIRVLQKEIEAQMFNMKFNAVQHRLKSDIFYQVSGKMKE